jgi:hypothetical protein
MNTLKTIDLIICIILILIVIYTIINLINAMFIGYNIFQFINVLWKLCLSYLVLRLFKQNYKD